MDQPSGTSASPLGDRAAHDARDGHRVCTLRARLTAHGSSGPTPPLPHRRCRARRAIAALLDAAGVTRDRDQLFEILVTACAWPATTPTAST